MRKRSGQNFADPNEPARYRARGGAIGLAMFIEAEPDQKRGLNRGGVKSEKIERSDSMPEQFQQAGGTIPIRRFQNGSAATCDAETTPESPLPR